MSAATRGRRRERLPALIVGGLAAALSLVAVLQLPGPGAGEEARRAQADSQVVAPTIGVDTSEALKAHESLPSLAVSRDVLGENLGPQDVLTAYGFVWVVTFQSILKLDMTDGSVVSSMDLSSEDGARLAAAGGLVWVSDGMTRLTALAPNDMEQVASLALEGGGNISALAGDGDRLWVGIDAEGLRLVDGTSGELLRSLPSGQADEITVTSGGIWQSGNLVSGAADLLDESGNRLAGIEPAGQALEAGGYAWVISYDGEESVVAGVDVETRQTAVAFSLPDAAALASDGDRVWAYSLAPSKKEGVFYPDPDNPGSIWEIEASSLTLTGEATWGLGPVRLATTPEGAWIVDMSTGQLAFVEAS